MKKHFPIALVPALMLQALLGIGCAGSSDHGADRGGGGMGAAQGGSVAQGGSATTGTGGSAPALGTGGSGLVTGGTSGASAAAGNPGISGAGGDGVAPGGGGGGSAGQGMSAAGTGAGGSVNVAQSLDGLRVDDPCAGTPDTSNGAVCNHVVLTNGGFKSAKEATLAGTAGTTYDVTLRIRGIVEPTQIDGGMRMDTTTFKYQNMTWRKVPFTIGGTVNRGDYSQWRITVESPKQEYYLNDYQTVGHYIFALDYQVTIPIAAGSKVTLDGYDSNEREIVNYEKYAIDGIPGSMNYGQFIQCNVVSAKSH